MTKFIALPLASISASANAQLLEDPPTVELPPEPAINSVQSDFNRQGDTPVRERHLDEFEAHGLPIGGFRLYPGLALASDFTSNVFADNDRRHADLAFIARPEVTLRSDAARHRLAIGARGDFRRFLRHTSEDTEEGLVDGAAEVAVGRLSSVFADVRFGSFVLSRRAPDSPVNAAKPLEYRRSDARIGARVESGRTRIVVEGDVSQLRFQDTPSLDGPELFTRDRDRSIYNASLRLERALTPAVSVYVQGTVNQIDYRLAPVTGTRDSKGYGAYLGASFELTRITRGDVRVGYIRQTFDLRNVAPIKGLGAEANILFFPSRLWDFRLHGESVVQDTGVPGTRGVYRRGGSAAADLELRRYIRAEVSGGYFRDVYRGPERRDNVYQAELGATYLSAGHWNAQLRYRFEARDCHCTPVSSDFDEHRLMATLTFQY